MQRNLLQRDGQLIGSLAAAQHWFSKAVIENAQVGSVRNRPFAAWFSDVSVADNAAQFDEVRFMPPRDPVTAILKV